MNGSCLPVAVLGNVPTYYRVDLPAGREPVYEWAAPVFLALAVASGGLWLARSRTVRTGRARALLWAAAGCLAVAYSAGWLWAHRDGNTVTGAFGTPAWLAVGMPLVWVVACGAVLAGGWRTVRPPASELAHRPEGRDRASGAASAAR